MPTTLSGDKSLRTPATAVIAARALTRRFTGLTIAVVTLSLLAYIAHERDLRELIVDLAFLVLTLFAIGSVGPRLRVATVVLALPTLIGNWTLHLGETPIPRSAVFACTTVFLVFLTCVVLSAVLRDQGMTTDTLVGGICAYFLLGVTWGTAYALVALASPGAFSVSPALAEAAKWGPPPRPFTPLLQYYSFVTLSTLGYGDMSPLSGGARLLSVLEGLTGQLYLAVLIARLIGLHTAQSHEQ